MSCSHLSSIRQPPKEKPVIHKEECTQCFQADTSEGGIDVCLNCFNGGCTGPNSMQHSAHHAALCHPIVLNIKKREIATEEPDAEMRDAAAVAEAALASLPPSEQLAARKAQMEQDVGKPTHEFFTEVRCLTCQVTLEPSQHEPLARCVESIMASRTAAQEAFLGVFDDEIKTDCSHCTNLVQDKKPPQLGAMERGGCNKCDVTQRIWLCLTCGATGCSRRAMDHHGQWMPGNQHAVDHSQTTGHPLVVKLGTITPEGGGDCWCYKCDASVANKNLTKHLAAFGIQTADQTATEMTTAEAALALNLNMNWSLALEEDGREAELAFGPGRTGLANLGNSCYLASVLQVLFALPHFEKRYFTEALHHLSSCRTLKPAECFQCQISKLSIGLLSGRYDAQPSEEVLQEMTRERLEREERVRAIKENRASEDQKKAHEAAQTRKSRKPLQNGIPPRMFKALIAGKHHEFSTGKQQDAFEYLHHLLDYIKQKEHASAVKFDPYEPFYFQQEERLECTNCHRVRYKNVKTTEVSLPIPLPEPLPSKEQPADATMTDAVKTDSATATTALAGDAVADVAKKPTAVKKPAKEYPPVAFESCLNEWSASATSEDFNCPHCATKVTVSKQTRMRTFPQVLLVHMRRFVYEGWVPEKLDIAIELKELGQIRLDDLRAKGLQPGEQELPQEAAAPANAGSGAAAPKVPDATIVTNLESMGFGTNACQRAALAVDNSSADAAATWLFSHMEDADINDPLPAPAAAAAGAAASSSSGASEPSAEAIENLAAMGFEPAACRHALKQCGNSAERAVEWLFSHAGEDIPMDVDSGTASSASDAKQEDVPIDVAPAGYELIGFITHMGKSTGSGHYIAHVRKDGRWLQYNDHKVFYVNNPMRAAAHAYLYFFRRIAS